jgi:hypothetical protein
MTQSIKELQSQAAWEIDEDWVRLFVVVATCWLDRRKHCWSKIIPTLGGSLFPLPIVSPAQNKISQNLLALPLESSPTD